MEKYDVVIIGSGIVGMTIAYQLLTRKLSKNILVIEKENLPGKHTSGRNSGVVHSGLYYKPDSLKAKVCVNGSKRLRRWVSDRNLYLNKCGKLILPTNEYLNKRIDVTKSIIQDLLKSDFLNENKNVIDFKTLNYRMNLERSIIDKLDKYPNKYNFN